MPVWLLSLAYGLHMAATVVWIGGLFFQTAILAPALDRALEPGARSKLLEILRRRFDPLARLSLAALVGTGLTQMAAHPNYQGLLVVEGRWALSLLAKHATIGGMVALAAYQTWVLYPRLSRQALLQARGKADHLPRSGQTTSALARTA